MKKTRVAMNTISNIELSPPMNPRSEDTEPVLFLKPLERNSNSSYDHDVANENIVQLKQCDHMINKMYNNHANLTPSKSQVDKLMAEFLRSPHGEVSSRTTRDALQTSGSNINKRKELVRAFRTLETASNILVHDDHGTTAVTSTTVNHHPGSERLKIAFLTNIRETLRGVYVFMMDIDNGNTALVIVPRWKQYMVRFSRNGKWIETQLEHARITGHETVHSFEVSYDEYEALCSDERHPLEGDPGPLENDGGPDYSFEACPGFESPSLLDTLNFNFGTEDIESLIFSEP